MTLLILLILVLIGGAIIYFVPSAEKIVFFVWAVCAVVWVLNATGITHITLPVK